MTSACAMLTMILLQAVELPAGAAPDPVSFAAFPDRLHAYTWFNWPLVPVDRLAEVAGCTPDELTALAKRMGLPDPPVISRDQWKRSYITIIRRNWHLLPYEQLLQLLQWTPEEMAYTLREDDFLYVKLGSLKPKCAPMRYSVPDEAAQERANVIGALVQASFPEGLGVTPAPLFDFVRQLSIPPAEPVVDMPDSLFSPRFCSSYFMLYGDPFLETEADPYPDGYLARLSASGVNGVWLQAVLYKLTPFPWDGSLSAGWEERLRNLRAMTVRAKKQGIGIYLYLNEPRAMPLAFFEQHPELKGVSEGDYAAMCSSVPEVQAYIRDGVARICREVPELAGFFTITASENLTNCWSHYQGASCARCKERGPETVVAEIDALLQEGVAAAGSSARVIAWDWGWKDEWAEGLIGKLPEEVSLQSVSEWSIPVQRGGIDTVVGEYSISVIGPGPRATRHWGLARDRGLRTLAKVQAGNTWELSAVPYIPAVANVAQHAANLRHAHVDGLMLGWTLGGCPSPNLEVFAEMGRPGERGVEEVLNAVARRRFGPELASAAVRAWKSYSAAFSEFPYNGGTLYMGPMQMGPANPLWETPTGYSATMVGLPYDALAQWRQIFPEDVFIAQFQKMADGFDAALAELHAAVDASAVDGAFLTAIREEMDVADAAAIHFRSVENQARFVRARDALAKVADKEIARPLLDTLEQVLRSEMELAKRLYAIQGRDSRIGFEASNHYFYVPIDLAAKVVNCQDLLTRWLPLERAKRGV